MKWKRAWNIQRTLERRWTALNPDQRGVIIVMAAWALVVRMCLPLCKYIQDTLLLLIGSTCSLLVVLVLIQRGLLDN